VELSRHPPLLLPLVLLLLWLLWLALVQNLRFGRVVVSTGAWAEKRLRTMAVATLAFRARLLLLLLPSPAPSPPAPWWSKEDKDDRGVQPSTVTSSCPPPPKPAKNTRGTGNASCWGPLLWWRWELLSPKRWCAATLKLWGTTSSATSLTLS
jgi:hypothetical protein